MAKVVRAARRDWRRPQFWRDLFLYFWCFSFVGHVVEIVWALLGNLTGLRSSPASTIPLFAVAIPYGLGAVALWLVVYPLVQNRRLNMVTAFLLSAILTSAIEFVCAALLVAFTGHNPFWDYSHRFLNLYGYTCFTNSMLFGLGSVVLLWWIFSWTEKILARARERYVNVTFWILFVGYVLSQIYVRILRG